MNKKLLTSFVLLIWAVSNVCEARAYSASEDYSSQVEKQIRSGSTSTADLIVNSHPRIWIKGAWDYNKDNVGSFAWQIVHGPGCNTHDQACDEMKGEFYGVTYAADDAGYMYGVADYGTYSRRYLWTILAAEGVARRAEWNLPLSVPWSSGTYDPQHTEDELLADARVKFLNYADETGDFLGAHTALHASAGYDWLVDRTYSNGTPVLSDADRTGLQSRLIALAETMKADCQGQGQLLGRSDEIYKYFYPIIGMALYEPDGIGISASDNAKAKSYLDDFDTYWIGKILPALNEQGGDGGWQSGLIHIYGEFPAWGYYGEGATEYDTLPYRAAPLLYAHYTATGQSFQNSVYDTGVLKYAGEFWNYMIYPDGNYVAIGEQSGGGRYDWIGPMFSHARRMYSPDAYDQWVGELIGWVRSNRSPDEYVNAGSYDRFDQLMFEQKYADARSAEQLGCGTRHFAKLGWVAMRSGFSSADDLASLFISQRYHWSDKNPYAQNSLHIYRSAWLIEGNNNTMRIDGQYQRTISSFPTVEQGVAAYSQGSEYDVGPGILDFESNSVYDYMKGDATRAYDSTKLSNFTRQVVYLKPDIFIIFDNVLTTSSDLEKMWFADPGEEPSDLGGGMLTVTNGNGMLWMKRLLPASVTVTLSAAGIEEVPAQSAAQDYFLHVMQTANAGTAASEVSADDAIVTESGDWYHVSVAGHQVSFSKNGGFEFDGSPVQDITPPVRSSGSPSGTLQAGTTTATLSLTTNEAATCRYSITSGTAYSYMTSTFSTTGGTSHSATVPDLQNGTSYNYYVRCNDTSGNYNTDDFRISFSVASGGACLHESDNPPCDGCVDDLELTAYIDRWKVNSSDVTLKELMEAIGLWKRGC